MSSACKTLAHLLFLFAVALPCYGDDSGCVMPRERVYIVRGTAGYWPAIRGMVDRVRCQNYEPVVLLPSQLLFEKDRIVERRRSGEEQGRVLIIGYSLGADGAALLARGLGREGIRVDRLMLIEGFQHPAISPNVEYCFNIYESRMSDRFTVFRGTAVSEISPHTRLWEINVAEHPELSGQVGGVLGHFTMANSPFVQDLIVSQLQPSE